VTFVSVEEQGYVRKIEHLTGKRLEVRRYPGFTVPGRVEAEPAAAARPPIQRKRRYYRIPRFA